MIEIGAASLAQWARFAVGLGCMVAAGQLFEASRFPEAMIGIGISQLLFWSVEREIA